MRGASLWLLAASGCRALLGFEDPQVIAADAPPDLSCAGWSIHGFDACALPEVGAPLALGAGTYVLDTNAGTLVDPANAPIAIATHTFGQGDGSSVMAVAVGELVVGRDATLLVVGARPALLASWSTITVDGAIDAGSHVGVRLGAGANPTACLQLTGAAGASAAASGGSGGGGGGAYRGEGGGGSKGDMGASSGGSGGSALAGLPSLVRGGCSGGRGGAAGSGAMPPSTPATTTAGGGGGGAIVLAARSELLISATGRVLAGGAGGEGAPIGSSCGGGGGGSGGYLGLDAPSVRIAGTVAANGGGGGGGANFATTGNPGEDGRPSATVALGGAKLSCGLGGANGAADTMLGGDTALGSDTCGGGGGGGGAGFVLIWSASFFAVDPVVSPPALVEP